MLYTKDIKQREGFDVVVVGGGVAGFCAAVASARNGAKTALIEDLGALGGILTTGGNPEIGIFYAYKKQAIAGIGWELCKRLEEKGFAEIPDFSVVDTRKGCSPSNVKVNIAMAENEMNLMCLECGVKLFFHTKIVDAIVEGQRVKGIVVAEKGGLAYIEAKVFIDCTGDGDVAYLCGAEQEKSDILQPGTFGYTFKCNNLDELDEKELRASFQALKAKGLIKEGDYWPEYHGTMKGFLREGGNNANHLEMDGSSAQEITNAEIEGRMAMARMLQFANANADVSVYPPADYAAPRETRRTVCDYVITKDDYLTGRIFPDSVSYYYYNLDLHSTKKDGKAPFELDEEEEKLPEGVVPTVPYSAMTVKGFTNLLTAGRCISSERIVMGALRVKSSCMGMGEAVGAAAALCRDGAVRDVDMEILKTTLRKQGAIVPDKSIFDIA